MKRHAAASLSCASARVVVWLLALAAALAAPPARADEGIWRSTLLRDHPLTGQIWDVRAGHAVTHDALLARLKQARLVLLGETHDNEDHHRLQADVFAALGSADAAPALVMEQFDTEFQPAIDAARSAAGATARQVADAGRMRGGWNFDFYAPLISRALATGAPVVAANLSRDAARTVMREGFQALGSERLPRLALADTWSPKQESQLRRDIIDGHCGHVPEDLLAGLVAAQRARDAVMADVLLEHAERGAVGIIGRGHSRGDRGVPRYVAERRRDVDLVSVALVEVEAERAGASDYLADNPGVDYLWFTPRAQRKDPCAGFSMQAKGG